MKPKLTQKQLKFVNTFMSNGGNGTQAALAAYDTDDYNTAAVIANENLNKPNIQNALEEAFPDQYLAKIHNEGLFASKGIYRQTGEHSWDKIDEVPDFPVIAKYLDMAYKVKGSYAPEKKLNVNIQVEPSDKVKSLAKKLNYGTTDGRTYYNTDATEQTGAEDTGEKPKTE